MAKWAVRSELTSRRLSQRCRGDVFLAPAYRLSAAATAEERPHHNFRGDNDDQQTDDNPNGRAFHHFKR